MKKNNFLILLILLMAAGSEQRSPQTLLSLWGKKLIQEEPVVVRTLASAPKNQCLKDVFNVETLKSEIKELEKKFKFATPVKGSWKHLNLASLPVPQANFLKSFGPKMGDQNDVNRFDYSTCEDVPCVINVMYGKENYTAGYVHYLWYLKFGHELAIDNVIPDQESKKPGFYNGKIIPFEEYLLSDLEQYAFWRTSLMLRAPLATLGYMKEIQKIPWNTKFEGSGFDGACGLAFSQGWIILRDGCLALSEKSPDAGYFYTAFIHELSHQVDFEEGRGTRAFYRSFKQDYLDISGMKMNEFVDASGATVRNWEALPGAKLPSAYGGGAPQENFAESLARFRTESDSMKEKLTSKHYKFVSDNYYAGGNYERETQIKGWLGNSTQEMGLDILNSVLACDQLGSSEVNTPPEETTTRQRIGGIINRARQNIVPTRLFKDKDFSMKLSGKMLTCINDNADEMMNNLKALVTINDPDGCLILNSIPGKALWEAQLKESLGSTFNMYLLEMEKNPESLKRIQEFYTNTSDRTLARETLINCYGVSNEEECFNDQIKEKALEKVAALDLQPEIAEELTNGYVARHSFTDIQQETKKHYKEIAMAHLDLMRTRAQETWDTCKNQEHNDDLSPTKGLMQIGNGYLISSFNNCLNNALPLTIANVAKEFSVDGVKIEHPKEELILTQEIQPEILKILGESYAEGKEKEKVDAQDFMSKDEGALRKELVKDLSWKAGAWTPMQRGAKCKERAFAIMGFTPLYHLKSELFTQFVQTKVCTGKF